MPAPTFGELCAMAGAIYNDNDAVTQEMNQTVSTNGWTAKSFPPGSSGFQAGVFSRGGDTVVAFRGTVPSNTGDLLADLKLGMGMNTSHFAQGEAVLSQLKGQNVTLTGHSLGGAIAQIVGNRARLPFVTFNAPGVAVLASRNIYTANPAVLGVRLAGAAASAVFSPGQAWSDIKSAFHRVRGVNVCLMGDPVSLYGVHYGKVVRLLGMGHGIGNVARVLATSSTRSETVDTYFPA